MNASSLPESQNAFSTGKNFSASLPFHDSLLATFMKRTLSNQRQKIGPRQKCSYTWLDIFWPNCNDGTQLLVFLNFLQYSSSLLWKTASWLFYGLKAHQFFSSTTLQDLLTCLKVWPKKATERGRAQRERSAIARLKKSFPRSSLCTCGACGRFLTHLICKASPREKWNTKPQCSQLYKRMLQGQVFNCLLDWD